MKKIVRLLMPFFAICATSVAAFAQYPNKPIRILVPFAPGGSSEIVSRAYGAEMSKILGQNVIVENKPGGAGNIAMVDAKGQPPDGYTLILGHVGTLAVNPAMFAKLPYDPVKDFVQTIHAERAIGRTILARNRELAGPTERRL